MSKIQNIDSHIIADIAERIERLITNARANKLERTEKTEALFQLIERAEKCTED